MDPICKIKFEGVNMEEITYEALNTIVDELNMARSYVIKNCEILKNRPHTHTLYGTTTIGLGPMIPDKRLIPKRERQLSKRTRKAVYTAYFLDENYHVLQDREVSKQNCTNLTTNLHFEKDGVHYSHGFSEFDGQKHHGRTCFMKYYDNKPLQYAQLHHSLLLVQNYEYLSSQKMRVTTIRFFKNATRTVYGLPVCLDAPIGADNSPVLVQSWEEEPENTDFSKWFI